VVSLEAGPINLADRLRDNEPKPRGFPGSKIGDRPLPKTHVFHFTAGRDGREFALNSFPLLMAQMGANGRKTTINLNSKKIRKQLETTK
jgi:hypothetical protein